MNLVQNGALEHPHLDACHWLHQVSLNFFEEKLKYFVDVPFSDIPEIAWEDASLSESYSDIFSLVDCSNSIATNQDLLDTHSEHNYKQVRKIMIFNISNRLKLIKDNASSISLCIVRHFLI